MKNSCGKRRGCSVTIILPYDSGIKLIFSRVHGTRNDISKILFMANISLDKNMAQERQMAKAAA